MYVYRRINIVPWVTEHEFRNTTSSCNPYSNAGDPYSNTHVFPIRTRMPMIRTRIHTSFAIRLRMQVPYSNANIVCNPYTNASNPYTNQRLHWFRTSTEARTIVVEQSGNKLYFIFNMAALTYKVHESTALTLFDLNGERVFFKLN